MIFISYRREDTAGHAGRLFDRLAERFGREEVFMDVDTIQPGQTFARAIAERVDSSLALVALIGDQWLNIKDKEGRRRLDNPDDFVRREIRAALDRGITLIPVLVEGARMPARDELPEEIRGLADRQALEISDTRFGAEANDLIRALEKRLPRRARRRVLRRRGALAWGMVGAVVLLAAGASLFRRLPAPAQPQDISGLWRGDVPLEGDRSFAVELDLRVSGGEILGTVEYPTGTGRIRNGRVEGNSVRFETEHVPQFESEPAVIQFAGEITSEGLRLTMVTPTGKREMIARRK
jgi:hypothetical protein